jgi:hypothetical protein
MQEAGLSPHTMMFIGPAVAVECRHRVGAHLDGAEWRVDERDGELRITNLARRALRSVERPTGVQGHVIADPCACGRTGPRVMTTASS